MLVIVDDSDITGFGGGITGRDDIGNVSEKVQEHHCECGSGRNTSGPGHEQRITSYSTEPFGNDVTSNKFLEMPHTLTTPDKNDDSYQSY